MRVSVRGSILPATLLAAMTALLAAQPFDEARFAALMRAVVRIEAGNELGSGIVLHQEGDSAVILTANHVVKSSTDIGVYFYGDPLKAKMDCSDTVRFFRGRRPGGATHPWQRRTSS